jgi:hypothetical protein
MEVSLRARRVVAAILIGLTSASPAFSAPPLSAVSGALRLEGGSPLPPGLEVRLVQLETGRVTTVRPDSAGRFDTTIEPGLYGLDVGKDGYEIVGGPHVVSALPGRTLTTNLALATVQAPAAVPAAGPRIVHDAVGCMAAQENPEIEAVIEPGASVAKPRVYFHAARDTEFRYVDMMPEVGRFVACLPAPREGSGPVTYYVSATADGVESRTADIEAEVIGRSSTCPAGRRMAIVCPCAGPVAAYLNGALSTPQGFVSGAQAAGIASTAIKIGAAIGVVGIGLILGDNGTPASPSR